MAILQDAPSPAGTKVAILQEEMIPDSVANVVQEEDATPSPELSHSSRNETAPTSVDPKPIQVSISSEDALEALRCQAKLDELSGKLFSKAIAFCNSHTNSGLELVDVHQLLSLAKWIACELDVPPIANDVILALITLHDVAGHLALDKDGFVQFIGDLLDRIVPSNAVSDCPSQTLSPVSSAGQIRISIASMQGDMWPIEVDDTICTQNLQEAIENMTGMQAVEQRLICHGAVLVQYKKLHEQGIVDGDIVYLVRVLQPPLSVQIADPSLQRAVEGVYKHLGETRDGRPIYRAHIQGSPFYLFHHYGSSRWVITDSHVWNGYDERCWAYTESNALHPGEMMNVMWRTWGRTKDGANAYKDAPHMLLQIVDHSR